MLDADLQKFHHELTKANEKTTKEFAKIHDLLNQTNRQSNLTPSERVLAQNSIIQKIGEDLFEKIFQSKAESLKSEIKKGVDSDLRMRARATTDRLREEIGNLRLRANVNLAIGVGITGLGVYLLLNTVGLLDTSTVLKSLAIEGEGSNSKFLKSFALPFLPRLLLVIFIEVFAYFFLRLYRDGLADSKYFENELTNVEAKLLSVDYSISTDHRDSIKIALEALSNTERNFVLEKDQTTVELERAKSESELTRNVIKTIPELFKKSDSK